MNNVTACLREKEATEPQAALHNFAAAIKIGYFWNCLLSRHFHLCELELLELGDTEGVGKRLPSEYRVPREEGKPTNAISPVTALSQNCSWKRCSVTVDSATLRERGVALDIVEKDSVAH